MAQVCVVLYQVRPRDPCADEHGVLSAADREPPEDCPFAGDGQPDCSYCSRAWDDLGNSKNRLFPIVLPNRCQVVFRTLPVGIPPFVILIEYD